MERRKLNLTLLASFAKIFFSNVRPAEELTLSLLKHDQSVNRASARAMPPHSVPDAFLKMLI